MHCLMYGRLEDNLLGALSLGGGGGQSEDFASFGQSVKKTGHNSKVETLS